MPARLRTGLKVFFFLALHFLASVVLSGGTGTLRQAVFWLPSGVAVAGLWLLGLRFWWVVAVATLLQRLSLHYPYSVSLLPSLGSSLEGVVGVLLLRRFLFRAEFARLRDALALFAVAALAPLLSIGIGWLNHSLTGASTAPFVSSWVGWWRMNALGMLMVVPTALTWLAVPSERVRARVALAAAVVGVTIVALLWYVMTIGQDGPMSVALTYLVLPLCLYAAVRFGVRGATAAGSLSACVVALATVHGIGPFMTLAFESRHIALQAFELILVAMPLLLGALMAEREAAIVERADSERFRHAMEEVLPDITYRLRADGTVLDMHVPTDTVGPFTIEQLRNRSIVEFLPHAAARMMAGIGQAIRAGRSDPVEYRFPSSGRGWDREARFVRLGPDEVLCLVRDISQQKRGERLLAWQALVLEQVATGRATEEVLATIVHGLEEVSEGGLCSVLLLRERRLHVAMAPSLPAEYNAAIEGVEIGPMVGSCGTAAYRGETVIVTDIATDPLWEVYKVAALPHGLRACWSVPIRAPTGDVLGTFAIYYREPRTPTPVELAEVERASALAGIAIEREQRESALRTGRDLLASINRNVREGLYRSTPDRGLIYVNEAFARMFGYDSPDEMLQVPSAQLYIDPEQREALIRENDRYGHCANLEVQYRRRDGTPFWGLTSSSGVRDEQGRYQFYDGAVSDITARKELEDQLRQAQKMEAVGKLAGGVAHDFNNLLTAIGGYAELLLSHLPPEAPAAEDAREILLAADRAAGLTRQLLAYSRKQILSPEVLDLREVVDHLGGMLRRLIGEDVRFVVLQAPVPITARVDRGQFEQVVVNLVLNARDAMPNGGTLTVTTTDCDLDDAFARHHLDVTPGAHVCLTVQDTGIGMDEETRSRAFDPFFTTKEQGKGTGLGLSTVYGIVRQSGGSVWLETEVGLGTSVRVYLPRIEERPVLAPPPDLEPVVPNPGGTILVVEDEPLVRDLVARTLRRAGFAVLLAEHGESGLRAAEGCVGTIDLLLTDVIMPRMGGPELAIRLLKLRPELRVLLVSGYASESLDLCGALAAGCEFLQKPFTPSVLLARVRALLAVERRLV